MTTVRNSSVRRPSLFGRLKKKSLALFSLTGRCLLISNQLAFRFVFNLCMQIFFLEQAFVKFTQVYSFICQLLFLTLSEVAIITDEERQTETIISSFTTLLFYLVFGYFASKVRDIYLKDWQGRRNVYRSCAKWILKIVIEWLKAVVIVICLREQGMEYQPNLVYNCVTFTYYMCTEKVLIEIIESAVSYFNFALLDSLEYLYVPIFLHSYTTLVSGYFVVYLYKTKYRRFALVSSYFTVYLQLKDIVYNYIHPLLVEKQMYSSFKMANNKDIEKWDDVCAICLNNMSKARITPCKHLFHPQCLKRCLKESYQCPLCKRDFLQ